MRGRIVSMQIWRSREFNAVCRCEGADLARKSQPLTADHDRCEGIYVQYGCGFCAPDGWLNFDASPTLRFERLSLIGRLYTKNSRRFPSNVRYGDIRRGLPLPDACCTGIYASHVLEHLSLRDFEQALVETYRILRPNGTFRLVVPDLHVLAERYVERARGGDPLASITFMTAAHLGLAERKQGLGGLLTEWLGNARHLSMWDFSSLRHALKRVGFTDIRRATFNDSDDPAFLAVEDPGRFIDACAVQARRPA